MGAFPCFPLLTGDERREEERDGKNGTDGAARGEAAGEIVGSLVWERVEGNSLCYAMYRVV